MNAVVTTPAPRAFSEPGVVAGALPQALVPTTFEGVFRMAQVIAASGMAPKGMDTPEACTVAIMNGLEIGLTPMQAVQSIAVVNGRPTVWGDAAKALCLGSPLCEDIIETIEGTGDAMVARCVAKRKGKSPSVGEFSVAKAKKANLWNKPGPWQQFPDRMLQLRARAFALRDAFPDVLRGVAIREEMEDVEVRDVMPPAPPAPPAPPPKAIEAKASAPAAKAAAKPAPAEPVAAAAASTPTPRQPDEVEDTTSYVVDPDAVLNDLNDNLARCNTAEAIEEGYDVMDVEATLSGFTTGDYVAKAREIKAKHLDRIAAPAEKQAEAPTPPVPETAKASQPVAALDDEPPAPPKMAGGLVTAADYELYITSYVVKMGDEAKMRKYWSDTRDTREQLQLDMQTRSRLQNLILEAITNLPPEQRVARDATQR